MISERRTGLAANWALVLGIGTSAVLTGAATTEGTRAEFAVFGALLAVCTVAGLAALRGATLARAASAVAFVGLLAPIAVVSQKTAEQVSATAISSTSVAQEGISVLCLMAVIAVARPKMTPLRRAEVWLLLYLAAALISAAWSVGPVQTFLKASQLCIAYALAITIIRLRGRGAIRDVVALMHVVLVAALVGLAVAPSQALVDTQLAIPVHRLHGVFPAIAPDILGIIAATTIIGVAAKLGPSWTWRDKRVQILLCSAYFGELLLTRARSPLIILALGLTILVALTTSGRRRAAYLSPLVAAVIIAGSLVFGQTISDFVYRGQSVTQVSSLTGRTTAWTVAIDEWKAHPFVGLGYYSGHRLSTSLDTLYHQRTNLDNLWVETLLDTGLLGAICLAMFVFTNLRYTSARVRKAAPNREGVHAVLAAFLLASFINPSLQQPGYTMIGFAVVLLASTCGYSASESV